MLNPSHVVCVSLSGSCHGSTPARTFQSKFASVEPVHLNVKKHDTQTMHSLDMKPEAEM